MSSLNEKQSVALSSVFASLGLTFGKLVVGLLTGSLGILSEAAHSGLDFLAALLTYFAVKTSDQPPNEQYPYGYAKVESVSALAETGLLFLTSIWIIYEAIHRFLSNQIEIQTTWYAIGIVVISILVDISRAYHLNRVAKATKSQALEADALHFSSDIWSSAAVLIGLVFNYYGFPQADSISALIVAIVVIHAGYSLGKRTLEVLIDIAPSGLTQKLIEDISFIPSVLKVRQLRVRQAGPTIFVDMIVEVSRGLVSSQIQETVKAIESNVKKSVEHADVIIHVVPVDLDSDTIVEKVRSIAIHFGYSIHHIFAHKVEEKVYLNFDLEVDSKILLREAYQISKKLESILTKEISEHLIINIHIEPLIKDPMIGTEPDENTKIQIMNSLTQIIQDQTNIEELHAIKIFKLHEGYIVSAHARTAENLPLQVVHSYSEEIEASLKRKILSLERLILHIEPKKK